MKRTLARFAAACGGVLRGADCGFAEAVIDSRKVGAGDLFLAFAQARGLYHKTVQPN